MSIFSRLFSRKQIQDLSKLGCDVHSHLLPGIDDGAKTVEEAVALLHAMSQIGLKKLVLTPHIKWGQFNNTHSGILDAERRLRDAMGARTIDVEFTVSAEYYGDEHFLGLIDSDELLAFGDGYILFECSFVYENPLLHEIVSRLKKKGYKPILAHFERYSCYHGSVEVATELRRIGCNIQLNLLSLTGHYGAEIRKQAELLVRSGEIDFVGTDCHRIQHLNIIEEHLGSKYIQALLQQPLKNGDIFV